MAPEAGFFTVAKRVHLPRPGINLESKLGEQHILRPINATHIIFDVSEYVYQIMETNT